METTNNIEKQLMINSVYNKQLPAGILYIIKAFCFYDVETSKNKKKFRKSLIIIQSLDYLVEHVPVTIYRPSGTSHVAIGTFSIQYQFEICKTCNNYYSKQKFMSCEKGCEFLLFDRSSIFNGTCKKCTISYAKYSNKRIYCDCLT